MSFKILGTGSYAPEHVVTNDDLSALVDTNDEWITQRISNICTTPLLHEYQYISTFLKKDLKTGSTSGF